MIGVLLLNLGGPDSLESVRPFLFNLFSDRDIIKLPVPSFLQRGLAWTIAALRSKKVIGYYRMIGGKSPILDITRNQAEALERFLNTNPPLPPLLKGGEEGIKYKVYFGMRYSPPFIKDVLMKIIKDGIKSLIVIPLFPQHSLATTGSSFKEVKRALNEFGVQVSEFRVNYIESWYDDPFYLDALSEKIKEGLDKFNNPENVQVIFSAHSLPKAFIDEGDPYLRHLHATISGVLERLGNTNYHLSFQSRSGPVRWLEPGTDEIIDKLAEEGHKEILIVPISFVSDHLETLYEIDILYRKIAEEKGVVLRRTESLNTSPKFIESLAEIVLSKKDYFV
ncbi:MAG: ferrochelatase [Nitrospirota bacterium]